MKKIIMMLLCTALLMGLIVPVCAAENVPMLAASASNNDALIFWAVVLGVGLLVGLITILIMRSGMKTAVFQRGAQNYIDGDSYHLHICRDIFLYSNVTRVRKQTDNRD